MQSKLTSLNFRPEHLRVSNNHTFSSAIFGGSLHQQTKSINSQTKTITTMFNPLWILVLVPSLVIAAPSSEKDMKGPVFIKEPDNRIDFSNSTGSVVECRANGIPPPEIIWVRSDGTAVGDVRNEKL
jgi:hypothetical protein